MCSNCMRSTPLPAASAVMASTSTADSLRSPRVASHHMQTPLTIAAAAAAAGCVQQP
jgi:hypothetical protein